jgi:hypothetical protein
MRADERRYQDVQAANGAWLKTNHGDTEDTERNGKCRIANEEE